MIILHSPTKALIDSTTGSTVYPACFDDLIQYYNYLKSRHHEAHAQEIVQSVFDGEKVISKMIALNQIHSEMKHDTHKA